MMEAKMQTLFRKLWTALMVVLGMISDPTTTETQKSFDLSAASKFKRPPNNTKKFNIESSI